MERINKSVARKLYNKGMEIRIVPCKCHPCGWMGCVIQKDSDSEHTFEQVVNAFEFYNCCYETGYYTAFYI